MKLSISDLKLHTTCPQKFHNRCVALRGVDKPSQALSVGTWLHRAMELKLKGERWEDALLEDIAELWRTQGDANPIMCRKAEEEFVALIPHIRAWELLPSWKVTHVEQEVEMPLFSVITLVGRLDTVLKWGDDEWHLQHKTLAGSTPSHVFAELIRTDWHEIAYDAMWFHLTGRHLKGTILNIFRKIKDQSKVNEIHYLARSPEICARGMTDIRERALQMFHEARGTRATEQTRTACAGPFHNSLCEYKEVCDGVVSLDSPQFVTLEPRYVETRSVDSSTQV